MTWQGIRGNNDRGADMSSRFAQLLELEFNGQRIAAYHGHHHPTRDALITGGRYEVVLLGHSHRPRVEQVGPTLVINPGSPSHSVPRRKDFIGSVAVYDSVTRTAKLFYLA